MAELLLELFSEEIPARMQEPAAEQLRARLAERLAGEGYDGLEIETFVTPRRLAAAVTSLADAQPDLKEERKGPRVDAPEKALNGFLKSVGLSKADLDVREDKKGAFYVANIERAGRPTEAVIADLVPALVRDFKWPKSMRWGAGNLRWVRPLHGILCLFDGKHVPFDVDGIASGDTTRGHRFLAPDPIAVTGHAHYVDELDRAKVILDRAQRLWFIDKAARDLAEAEGLVCEPDRALLEENAGLVEWPVVLIGRIDATFVKPIDQGGLPPEVLISAMAKHQRYFSVRDKAGALAPHFILVSNLDAEDGGKEIVAGNERVLRARLSDAKFFWDQDRKVPLADRVEKLGDIVFHAKLGTVREKVARVEQLAASIAKTIGADPHKAGCAAHLAKADLVTGIVGEFPDLQGLMGSYYAAASGEDPDVAKAIGEHYLPAGAADRLPATPVSMAVALADKIDTLVAFWSIGETPTGSKDPFALRRAALGVIRIVSDNMLRLRLVDAFESHAGALDEKGQGSVVWSGRKVREASVQLLSFFADRLKVHLRDQGIKHDLIDAVFALDGQDDLVLIVERVKALKAFLESDDGTNLLTAYRRASNILRIEEKKDKTSYEGKADPAAFVEDAERALHGALNTVVADAAQAIAAEDFAAAMTKLSELRAPVDAFFDNVTVNADKADVRRNRLRLLSQIRDALESVADFSKIEG